MTEQLWQVFDYKNDMEYCRQYEKESDFKWLHPLECAFFDNSEPYGVHYSGQNQYRYGSCDVRRFFEQVSEAGNKQRIQGIANGLGVGEYVTDVFPN